MLGARNQQKTFTEQLSMQRVKFITKKRGPNAPLLTESQLAFVDDTPANVRAARALGWHASLVCLLKPEHLETWHRLNEQELNDLSTSACHLVFGEEAARRVENLFSKLI